MNIIKFILLTYTLINISCTTDIYNIFPKGTKLNKEILKKSNQIVLNKNDIILVYDMSTDPEYVDFHLLFFRRNDLKLYGATYFYSTYIKSINEKSINAYAPIYNSNQKLFYRHDSPKNYEIKYIKCGENYTTKNTANSLVEKIEVKHDNVNFFVKKSKDIYLGIQRYGDINSTFISKFNSKDTIQSSLLNIVYYYDVKEISIQDTSSNAIIKVNILIVPNDTIFDIFFDDLLKIAHIDSGS